MAPLRSGMATCSGSESPALSEIVTGSRWIWSSTGKTTVCVVVWVAPNVRSSVRTGLAGSTSLTAAVTLLKATLIPPPL